MMNHPYVLEKLAHERRDDLVKRGGCPPASSSSGEGAYCANKPFKAYHGCS